MYKFGQMGQFCASSSMFSKRQLIKTIIMENITFGAVTVLVFQHGVKFQSFPPRCLKHKHTCTWLYLAYPATQMCTKEIYKYTDIQIYKYTN